MSQIDFIRIAEIASELEEEADEYGFPPPTRMEVAQAYIRDAQGNRLELVRELLGGELAGSAIASIRGAARLLAERI